MVQRENTRKHPRFTVQIEARLLLEPKHIRAATKDMSHGGICLIAPIKVDPGSELRLSLSLVLGTNAFSESLELSGRVIWCTEMEGEYQIGILFTGMTSEKNGYLDMFLRFLQQEILFTGLESPDSKEEPNDSFDISDPEKN